MKKLIIGDKHFSKITNEGEKILAVTFQYNYEVHTSASGYVIALSFVFKTCVQEIIMCPWNNNIT